MKWGKVFSRDPAGNVTHAFSHAWDSKWETNTVPIAHCGRTLFAPVDYIEQLPQRGPVRLCVECVAKLPHLESVLALCLLEAKRVVATLP